MKTLSIQLIILLLCFVTVNAQTKKEFWGMTYNGGIYNCGTIFKTDGNGEYQSVLKNFPYPDNGISTYNKLCEIPDGRMFGLNTLGGINQIGEIFEYNPTTNTYIKKFDFSDLDGIMPFNSLVLADNGKLYGTTLQGGKNNMGVIFEWDPATDTYSKKVEFTRYEGAISYGSLMKATNGKLYGTTFYGGMYDYGIIFEWDPTTGNFTKKYDFNFSTGYNNYGSLLEASNGKFYGMTAKGGSTDWGVLFEWDLASNTYTKLIDFGATDKGGYPHGSLIQANDGNLYGMISNGGANGAGIIFEYNFINNTFTNKFDFVNSTTGNLPQGSLVQATNGKLYGMTSGASTFQFGALFEWDITSNTFTKKLDFNGNNGKNPGGTLILSSNGKLYGTTKKGGINNLGVLFEWNPITDTYSKKVDINGERTGAWPYGSLTQANNGKLYGITYNGGVHACGEIFEWDFSSNNIITKYNFYYDGFDYDKNIFYSDGLNPFGKLLEASNGKFYGLTQQGGKHNDGVIFEWDPVSNNYIKKFDFESSATNPTGNYVYGSLIQANNGKLYGMTSSGGENIVSGGGNSLSPHGVIFEWNINSDTYTKKIIFNGTEKGSRPYGDLLQASNGKLYGLTSLGGANNLGVLFEYDIATNTYVKKIDFNGALNGSNPCGSLIQASNGKLYGLTSNGGLYNMGILFEFDPTNDIYIKKIDFSGTANGQKPKGTLMQSSNSKLYGLTSSGGTYAKGVMFEYDPINNILIKKLDYNGTNGSSPQYTQLIELTLPVANITSATSGNWEYNKTWKENMVPGPNDNVRILAGHSVTSTNNSACKDLNIEGNIIVSSGKNLNVNGTVTTIATSPSSIGQIVLKDNSATLTSTGRVEVQLSIPDNNYHLLSSPMTNALADVLLGYTVARFYESLYSYTNLVKGSPLIKALGYSVKKGTSPLYPPSSLLTFWANNSTGLNTGDISITTTKSVKGGGWNLVGNPYPCAINLDLLDAEVALGWHNTNLSPWIYTWNLSTGKYEMYNMSDGNKTTYGSKYVPPMQGVWVLSTTNQGSWSMDNRVRVANDQPYWKKGNETTPFISNMLKLFVKGNGFMDESMIMFSADATNDFDATLDAYKLYSEQTNVPQLNSVSMNNQLAVNYLPEELMNQSKVQLEFTVGVAGTYTITADQISSFTNQTNITLVDTKTNTRTDLQNSSYTFTSEAVQNDQRFYVEFGASPTSVKESNLTDMINIFTDKNQIVVQNKSNINEQGTITVYDVLGKEITSRSLTSNSETRLEMSSQAQAVYFVKVMTGKQSVTKKVCITR